MPRLQAWLTALAGFAFIIGGLYMMWRTRYSGDWLGWFLSFMPILMGLFYIAYAWYGRRR